MYTHIYICLYSICVHIYVCIHILITTHLMQEMAELKNNLINKVHIFMYRYDYTYMYEYVNVYTYIHMLIYTYFICIRVCMYVCIYILITTHLMQEMAELKNSLINKVHIIMYKYINVYTYTHMLI
jgi:hypothetical protein